MDLYADLLRRRRRTRAGRHQARWREPAAASCSARRPARRTRSCSGRTATRARCARAIGNSSSVRGSRNCNCSTSPTTSARSATSPARSRSWSSGCTRHGSTGARRCRPAPTRLSPKRLKRRPSQDRAALFATKDKDHDGKLTREEFLGNQSDPEPAKLRFDQWDTDKNNSLSLAEFVTMGKTAN